MFDPEFDPFDKLLDVEHKLSKFMWAEASAHNEISDALTKLTEKLNEMIRLINIQDDQIQLLHGRLKLLEVARQYGEFK